MILTEIYQISRVVPVFLSDTGFSVSSSASRPIWNICTQIGHKFYPFFQSNTMGINFTGFTMQSKILHTKRSLMSSSTSRHCTGDSLAKRNTLHSTESLTSQFKKVTKQLMKVVSHWIFPLALDYHTFQKISQNSSKSFHTMILNTKSGIYNEV